MATYLFFLPRWTPEGQRNHIYIQRLKDKMGNHANASSEVEFNQAWALKVGEVGAGVRTIIGNGTPYSSRCPPSLMLQL